MSDEKPSPPALRVVPDLPTPALRVVPDLPTPAEPPPLAAPLTIRQVLDDLPRMFHDAMTAAPEEREARVRTMAETLKVVFPQVWKPIVDAFNEDIDAAIELLAVCAVIWVPRDGI